MEEELDFLDGEDEGHEKGKKSQQLGGKSPGRIKSTVKSFLRLTKPKGYASKMPRVQAISPIEPTPQESPLEVQDQEPEQDKRESGEESEIEVLSLP